MPRRAVRRAVAAAGPGGRLVVDRTFDISEPIEITHDAFRIEGTGGLRAVGFPATPKLAMLRARAPGMRIAGISLDQRNRMVSGISVLLEAPDCVVAEVVSRATQRA